MADSQKDKFPLSLRFGGGQHSSRTADEIDARECTEGKNYDLDLENTAFKVRPPFDLIGTVPNAAEIRGGITLKKTDGTTSTLFQAGNTVYEWDGDTTFTSKATVNASSKLRGRIDHGWALDDKVFITDLNLQDVVMEWDGTTLSDMTENLTGDFKAKYCYIANERVYFANVESNSVATPHMLVGSTISDNETLSTANVPSSALGVGDPFYMLMPDLKPINGYVGAFGQSIISTEGGSIYKLTGTSAKDFAIQSLYADSSASGSESLIYTGNDVVYGRPGVIESISATDKFGDVENNDMSRWISDAVRTYTGWTNVYNRRTKRAYFFPTSQSEVWAFNQAILEKNISPWAKWTTTHASAFQPTFVMNMFDPADNLEYIFFGDSSGNVYRLEGTGSSGDAGSAEIIADRKSALISMPENMIAHSIDAYLKYLKQLSAVTVTVTYHWQGEEVHDVEKTLTMDSADSFPVYGDDDNYYYNDGETWYGVSGLDKIYRQRLAPEGSGQDLQITLSVTGSVDFEILEHGINGKMNT